MAKIYKDPIIKRLITVLNAEGPPALKNRYYYGDPIMVAKSVLPACFITKDETLITAETNMEDRNAVRLVLNVVYDLTRDFNKSLEQITGANSLYEMMEGRDATTYNLLPNTIAYVLRKYQTLDGSGKLWIDIDTETSVDYGVRLEQRGPGIYTVEGVISCVVRHVEVKPS